MTYGVRDSIKAISVNWLADGTAEKLFYAIGLVCDTEIESKYQGTLAHCPGRGTPTALGDYGADVVIERGPREPPDLYAYRLSGAHDAWRIAGNALAIATAVQAYNSPDVPLVRVVGNNSIWDWLDAGGEWTKHYGASNWSWDGFDGMAKWWRLWVIVYQPSFAQRPGTWDTAYGATWDAADGTWDTTATPDDVAAIFRIVNKWKPACAEGVNDVSEIRRPMVIVCFDATLFDPTKPAGGGINPDGLFGRQYKSSGGVVVPSRFAAISCWEGK